VTYFHNITMYGELFNLTVENIPDNVANLECHNKILGISRRRVGLPYNFVCLDELSRANTDTVPPKNWYQIYNLYPHQTINYITPAEGCSPSFPLPSPGSDYCVIAVGL
jgi:hypothetical protein